jgi:hypothetical protein
MHGNLSVRDECPCHQKREKEDVSGHLNALYTNETHGTEKNLLLALSSPILRE